LLAAYTRSGVYKGKIFQGMASEFFAVLGHFAAKNILKGELARWYFYQN